jgi:hypothetical protein
MAPLVEDISGLVLKRAEQIDPGSVTLDGQHLNTLLALDGKKTLAQVARQLRMDMLTLRQAVSRLIQLKLVVRVNPRVNYLPESFMTSLKAGLANGVGPIAGVLLDDVLADMKLRVDSITQESAPELIRSLAREIPDDSVRVEFIRAMLSKLA